MSEATAVEVTVGVGVVLAVVYLRKLQTAILMKVLPVEVLVGTEDLHREKEFISEMNCGNIQLEVSLSENKSLLMKDQKVKKSQGSCLLVIKQLGCLTKQLKNTMISHNIKTSE